MIGPLRRLVSHVAILPLLIACASTRSAASPTLAVEAIYTAARQTFSAQETSSAISAAPAGTLTPTPAATSVPSPTQITVPSSACDGASYVSDVTIPDGTVLAAGSNFVKTWLLQNTGTCTWTTGYKLSFQAGDAMGGAEAPIAAPVSAGNQVELSIGLTAPAAPGTYTGQWRMKNAAQQPFGDIITVEISVGAPGECRKSSNTQVTIAGHINLNEVTIYYGDGTVQTDSNGNYSFAVPMGWSGTVIPSKARVNPWTFEPAQRTYSALTCDMLRENYRAIPPPGV